MFADTTLRTVKKTLYILFAITLLISCRDNGAHRTLLNAEQLLETDVVAADSILESMTPPSSKRDRAWYAVLKTQATYKQYKPITTDSLILTATQYYGSNRKSYRAAMAWYTQGCTYVDMSNDSLAVVSFMRALDLFPDTIVRYYTLTEQRLGDVFQKNTMYDQALNIFERCRNGATYLGDSSIIAYCDYKIATIYLYEKKYELADSMYVMLLDNPYLSDYYRNEAKINYCKVLLYGFNDVEAAYDYLFHNAIKGKSKSFDGVTYSIMGIMQYQMCNYDSAYHYFNMSLESVNEVYTRSIDYCYLYELSTLKADYEKAHYFCSKYTNIIDSIIVIETANDVAAAKMTFACESYNNKRKELIIRTIVISSSLSIVVLLLVTILYQRNVRKYQDYYIKMSDQNRLKQFILKQNSSESEILDYCLQLFCLTPSYDIIKQENCIITNPLRKSILHDLTVSFSEYYSFARSQYPDFNTNYINYCILHYLEFSKQQIVDILCISENNYRVSKSRIRKMIDSSNRLYPK